MSKLEEMNLDEVNRELAIVRDDIQYLDEKLSDRKAWRSRLIWRRRCLLRDVKFVESE